MAFSRRLGFRIPLSRVHRVQVLAGSPSHSLQARLLCDYGARSRSSTCGALAAHQGRADLPADDPRDVKR